MAFGSSYSLQHESSLPDIEKSSDYLDNTHCSCIYKYALEIMEVIGTEGALKRPMTYDNHHIHPSIPTPHIALKTTSHELR